MTDWSDVEFSSRRLKAGKAQDFLPITMDLLTCFDFLGCVSSGLGALALYTRHVLGVQPGLSVAGSFWRDIVFGSLIAALVLRAPSAGLNPRLQPMPRLVLVAEQKCLLSFGALIAVGLATRATDDLARLWLLGWFGLFALYVGMTRLALGLYLQRLHERGELREAVAIIGAAGPRERMAARLASEADIVGLFGAGALRSHDSCGEDTDAPQVTDEASADSTQDDLTQLLELGRDGGLDAVLLATEGTPQGDLGDLISRLKALPVQVAVCTEGSPDRARPRTRLMGGMLVDVVADRPLKRWDLLLKTLVDRAGSLLMLVLLAPVMLAIALAVTATSPGPVIFRQRRQGWCGREFVIFKFRTMRHVPHESEQMARGRQTSRGDPRCTSLGRFLRATSLDELPQLWNVLRGDMSLVGPRPHAGALHDLDRAGREIVAEYAQRHRMKPGLTGWAQIHGARGATNSLAQLRRRVEYDLYYIENWSLWLDLQIIIQTPFCLVGDNVF